MMPEIAEWLNDSGDRIDCRQIACSHIWNDYDGLIVAKMVVVFFYGIAESWSNIHI